MSDVSPYVGHDFYCDVALQDPSALDVVHDGEHVLAYHHTRPHWPVHVVVVPKRHVPSLTDLSGADEPLLRELLAVVRKVAAHIESEHGAARVVTNLGRYQDSKHLHVHVASGESLDRGRGGDISEARSADAVSVEDLRRATVLSKDLLHEDIRNDTWS